jgi:NtrC-family two-component system response regulator AlgB
VSQQIGSFSATAEWEGIGINSARPEARIAEREPVSASIMQVARRAALAGCSLLILGETGVGKGRLAEWIHRHSRRAGKPFVPVNCGAIPETLIDSHLFGHARGAFTGATADHRGLVRAAAGGTLFLDEVGSLPFTAQTRLLRLLQEREAQPVGYAQPVPVDIRIVAATNCDLAAQVRRGEFREDLYYRLDVVRLELKPLRDRAEEIPGLVEEFNAEFALLYQQQPLRFTSEAMDRMRSHDWPGNVRQLRTIVERLHVLCADEVITAAHLRDLANISDRTARPASLTELKLEVVNQAIASAHGSMTKAASALGVHRSTLYRWLAANRAMSA